MEIMLCIFLQYLDAVGWVTEKDLITKCDSVLSLSERKCFFFRYDGLRCIHACVRGGEQKCKTNGKLRGEFVSLMARGLFAGASGPARAGPGGPARQRLGGCCSLLVEASRGTHCLGLCPSVPADAVGKCYIRRESNEPASCAPTTADEPPTGDGRQRRSDIVASRARDP